MSLQTSLPSGKPKTRKVRYTVLALIWLVWLLSLLDRMVTSVSLPYIGRDLNLDTTQQGLTINTSFTGYVAFQVPGGLLAGRFGSCKTIAIGITWWSMFASLTGVVMVLSPVLTVRFFPDIGEGCPPSASWRMISAYFPLKERGCATVIQLTVNILGPALAMVVVTSIIGALGWHIVSIVLGIPGLFIVADIYLLTCDNPKDHPAIMQQDLARLAAGNQGSLQNTSAIAFKDALKMSVLWQMAGIWFLFDITFWGFSTWPPGYLITVQEFSLAKTGVMTATSFLFEAGGTLLGGYCSGKFKPQRKMLYVIISVIAAGFPYLAFNVNSADMTVVYQCVSALFMFPVMAMFWGILMDMISSNIMRWASGIVNFGGQMTGVISVPIIGWLIQSNGGSCSNTFILMIVALLYSVVVTLVVKNSHVVGALPSRT